MRVVFVLDPNTGPAGDPGPVLQLAARLPAHGIEIDLFWFGDTDPSGPAQTTHRGTSPASLPPADLLVATSADTVEFSVAARRAPVVRLVTESEPAAGRPVPTIVAGDAARIAALPHGEVHEVGVGVDLATFHPRSGTRRPGPSRVGTLGFDAAKAASITAALAGFDIHTEGVRLEDSSLSRSSRPRAALLQDLDVLVLAGDGDERAAVEAMACGIPCVLGDTPAVRAWLGDRSGAALLVDTGDIRCVTEALVFLIRHQGLRRDVQEAGKQIAEQNGCDLTASDLARTLRRARERAGESHARLAEHTAPATGRSFQIPTSPLAWTQVAAERLAYGDASGALRATDRALAAGGSSCRLFEIRANALEALSRDDDALHAFDMASDHRDASPQTFRELARHLRRCGELARARIAEDEAAVRAACG
jgi:hypothetical protein